MRRAAILLLALGAAAAVTVATVHLLDPALAQAPARGTRPAPEFPTGLDWINTDGEALSLSGLRGRVVLLDFWTYGCINCIHILPDLRRLKEKYGDALVVIGVHSAKFEREGRTENIRKIAQRYGRDEPIVNDHEFTIWRSYGVRAWPTLVLIDPAGNGVGQVAGEGHYDLLDGAIGRVVEDFTASGALETGPLPFDPDPEFVSDTPLRFPGKVIVDTAAGRVFIADSNHGRVIEATLDGEVTREFDGFDGPQGLALADGALFVADTTAHLIRRVDLEGGEITTVAGTGVHAYLRDDEYPALETGLNSPWDLLWHDGTLYIAMAGQHQLWTLRAGVLRAFAGTRREALRDGPRLAAAFNQPSGLALADGVLYVADSEASAVRAIDLASGSVTTPVGTGLFDFGDQDGVGTAVRLQHPLGVAVLDGAVYVADTYNGKLKRLDPTTREVRTVLDGLDEPGGLSVGGGLLYIADTNHHAVRVFDPASGSVTEFTLRWPLR